MDFQDNLSELQKSKLAKAITSGSDVRLKLAKDALTGSEFSFLNKVQARRLEKAKTGGKGMVLHLSSNQLKGIKGSSYPPKDIPMIPGAKTKKLPKKVGSAVPVMAIASGVMAVANSIGLIEPLKGLVSSLIGELEYMLVNPEAGEFKKIYLRRLPDLGLKYNRLQNDIDFLRRKPKQTAIIENKINRIMRHQADIVALGRKLLTQLPRLKEIAQSKDAKLAAKEAAKREAEINKLEAQIESLKGEGMQVGPPPKGSGMQVGPPPMGSGLQISRSGLPVSNVMGAGKKKKLT